MCLHRIWCSAWSTVCCRVHLCVVFVPGALRWVTHGRSQRLPAERSYPTQWHTWEVGRGGGGRFESRRRCNARVSCFASHCACACRACVSETLETRRAVAPTCLRCTVCLHRIWCSAWSTVCCRVHLCVVFVPGALRWVTHGRSQRLPALRGDTQRVAAPDTLADLLGARAERVPDCSSYLSRIPWSATDSGLSIHPRYFRGSPSGKPFHASAPARASPRLIKRQRC